MPGIAGSSLEPRQFLRHGFSNGLAEDVRGWNFLFVWIVGVEITLSMLVVFEFGFLVQVCLYHRCSSEMTKITRFRVGLMALQVHYEREKIRDLRHRVLGLSSKDLEKVTKSQVVESLAILCALFGMVKWPFQGLSDLQLGDKKVTKNHLVRDVFQIQPLCWWDLQDSSLKRSVCCGVPMDFSSFWMRNEIKKLKLLAIKSTLTTTSPRS